MHDWVTLTTRWGASFPNPNAEQLREALEELFGSDDPEHPDSWIECGSEDAPLHSFSFFPSGRGIYTKYSDADMTEELESKEFKASNPTEALGFWMDLINE